MSSMPTTFSIAPLGAIITRNVFPLIAWKAPTSGARSPPFGFSALAESISIGIVLVGVTVLILTTRWSKETSSQKRDLSAASAGRIVSSKIRSCVDS